MKNEITYTGKVTNVVTGEVFETRKYPTWEAAHLAAERLAKRRSVYDNCTISVD